MPIYVDESGSLQAGAMVMAGIEIDARAAEQLLDRFRDVTGLRGEMKGSRIGLVERAYFFELLERFGGRARVCIAPAGAHRTSPYPDDFDVYVALLARLVGEWLPDSGDCVSVVIDEGRYDRMVLESVRDDIARLLPSCGSAHLVDSRRSSGVQIADVVANSFYNIAVSTGRAGRVQTVVEPFLRSGLILTSRLDPLPEPRQKHPALRGNAGRPVKTRSDGVVQPS
jgi:hypothetical protein